MIEDGRLIARHYVFGARGHSFGWFWIDFPAAIPWSAFSLDALFNIRDTGYIFNLPKLARVFHLPSQVVHLPCFRHGKLFLYN